MYLFLLIIKSSMRGEKYTGGKFVRSNSVEGGRGERSPWGIRLVPRNM